MEPPGHRTLTDESVKAAVRDFPPALDWLRKYLVGPEYRVNVSDYNVGRDISDIATDIPRKLTGRPPVAFWGGEGQKHHFMRIDRDPPTTGYQKAIDWMQHNATEAVVQIHKVLKERQVSNPSLIIKPLGDALHTLQESYSEGHVSRKQVGNNWTIFDVFVWDDDNKKTHTELDKMWKNPTDPRRKEAIDAGRELIKAVVISSRAQEDADMRLVWRVQWGKFVSKFFQQNLREADAAWDKRHPPPRK